jgi:hypothetical protein
MFTAGRESKRPLLLTAWDLRVSGNVFRVNQALMPGDEERVDRETHRLERTIHCPDSAAGCLDRGTELQPGVGRPQERENDFAILDDNVATLLVFGSEDVGQNGFIVDEQPKIVADEILAHLRVNPVQQGTHDGPLCLGESNPCARIPARSSFRHRQRTSTVTSGVLRPGGAMNLDMPIDICPLGRRRLAIGEWECLELCGLCLIRPADQGLDD